MWQWTFWYILYCDSQETFNFPSLVPSHYCFAVLLAFIRHDVTAWNFLCRHELQCSCINVRILLFDGNETPSKVVQSYDNYNISNFPNGRRCCCYHAWILLLLKRYQMQNWKWKQYCSFCYVRKLPIFIFTILYWPLFQARNYYEKAKISVKLIFFCIFNKCS